MVANGKRNCRLNPLARPILSTIEVGRKFVCLTDFSKFLHEWMAEHHCQFVISSSRSVRQANRVMGLPLREAALIDLSPVL